MTVRGQRADIYLLRCTVAACSGVLLVAFAAFVLMLPASDHPAPARILEPALPKTAQDDKADRLAISVQAPEQIVPPDDPPELPVLPPLVPPLSYQSKANEPTSKPQQESNVCTRHGMHKQTYHRGRHESWRCVN